MYLVEYNSNNSGGGWWLKDKDWIALAKAGWYVVWGGFYFCGSEYYPPPQGRPTCDLGNKCRGHRRFDTPAATKRAKDGRWLGGLAREATKEFANVREAVEEFERITGQDASAEGCNCCGPPHSFSWTKVGDDSGKREGYASGEEVLPVLYGEEGPASLRDAYRAKYGR